MRVPLTYRVPKYAFLPALLLFLSACAIVRTPQSNRIALLASFEGRYREVGYNALYAGRLALADAGTEQVELLPIDDGGTQAASHAAGLAQDPLIVAVIVLSYDATAPETLEALDDIPVLVVGDWGAASSSDSVFILSSPEIANLITAPPRVSVTDGAELPAPVTGGDVFALEGFAKLRESLDGVMVVSSGSLPDADFAARYQGSDPFAPEPGLLATLTYDATMISLQAAQTGSRQAARDFISRVEYEGINGTIRFQDGYWLDAPIHRYHYENSVLVEDTVE
jgi:hypothetical protein